VRYEPPRISPESLQFSRRDLPRDAAPVVKVQPCDKLHLFDPAVARRILFTFLTLLLAVSHATAATPSVSLVTPNRYRTMGDGEGSAKADMPRPKLEHPTGRPDLSPPSGLRLSAHALVAGSYSRMGPNDIVQILIETDVCARDLIEASVHLPHRGTLWVATYRDPSGRQLWRTTGSRDRKTALALADQWEAEAKQRRAAQGALPRKPTIRVRPGSAERELGLLTQREVGVIMQISERAVREIERRAFDKLRRHPALKGLWQEWATGEIKEALPAPTPWALSRAEIAAVYGLTRTPFERQALRKLIALTQGANP
jgi:hypothetical protein